MRAVHVVVCALTVVAGTTVPGRADTFTALCRPVYGDACSEAIGRWLPRVFRTGLHVDAHRKAAMTQVHDEIVDPAGVGTRTFLGQHAVFAGTNFVYGIAGPPKGRLVYDPAHRIEYLDEGCCSWHHVVVVSNAAAPPKTVAERSLVGLHTMRGLRLGDSPQAVRSVFGASPEEPSTLPHQTVLAYQRTIVEPKPYSSCLEYDTFVFRYERLSAIEFGAGC
jgi:hypothetical protein